MRCTSIAIAALLLGYLAPGAAAQSAGDSAALHQGFWVGVGLGGGSNLSGWADGARAGVGAYVRLGGTVSQRLLIGGEAIGWGRDRNGSTFSEGGVTAVAILYPAERGLFLKGGAGFAFWAVQSNAIGGGSTTQSAGGFAGTAGIGYDLRIGGNLYLTPNLDFLYHTMESENTVFADIGSGTVLLFTLGLTWH